MAEKDQNTADTASEPQVEAVEIEDGELEVVTGGLINGIIGPTGPTDPCITSIH